MIGDAQPQRYGMFAAERVIVDMLAYRTPGQNIVEIGAREGMGTKALLASCRYSRMLHVIDPWNGSVDGSDEAMYREFCRRILPHPNVVVHRMLSHHVTPPDDLGLVVHDGDHANLSDIPKWWNALMVGGILVAHDTYDPGWPNVRPAMEALGAPWHEYRYQPTPEDQLEYGPSLRGLMWKVKV